MFWMFCISIELYWKRCHLHLIALKLIASFPFSLEMNVKVHLLTLTLVTGLGLK